MTSFVIQSLVWPLWHIFIILYVLRTAHRHQIVSGSTAHPGSSRRGRASAAPATSGKKTAGNLSIFLKHNYPLHNRPHKHRHHWTGTVSLEGSDTRRWGRHPAWPREDRAVWRPLDRLTQPRQAEGGRCGRGRGRVREQPVSRVR